MSSPNLAADYVSESQAAGEVVVNDNMNLLDALCFLVLQSSGNTPPGSPTNGYVYNIGGSPTGAWSGHANQVAIYSSGWVFKTPKVGWFAWYITDGCFLVYSGSAWVAITDTVTNITDNSGGTPNGSHALAAISSQTNLTDSSGGSASGTISACGDTTSSNQATVINNAFASFVAKITALNTAMNETRNALATLAAEHNDLLTKMKAGGSMK